MHKPAIEYKPNILQPKKYEFVYDKSNQLYYYLREFNKTFTIMHDKILLFICGIYENILPYKILNFEKRICSSYNKSICQHYALEKMKRLFIVLLIPKKKKYIDYLTLT